MFFATNQPAFLGHINDEKGEPDIIVWEYKARDANGFETTWQHRSKIDRETTTLVKVERV